MKKAILWMAALSMVALQSCRQDDVVDAVDAGNTGKFGANGSELTWTLTDDGTMVIEGKGAMEDWGASEAPWVDYREDIRVVVIKDGVTNIGDWAFANCENLVSATLSESSVTSIEYSAARACPQ